MAERFALENLANSYVKLDEPQEAIKLWEQALAITRDLCDKKREEYILNQLSDIYAALGEMSKSAELHKRASVISHDIGDMIEE